MPVSFFLRRIHSITGLCLVLFLFEHFITNSQAAYFLDEGSGFIKTVNFFQSIPYLHLIEITLIGIPFLFHASLGIKYIFSSENNFKYSNSAKPFLRYSRNGAYVWQRITSYLIIVLLIFHVVQMRFMHYPAKVSVNNQTFFLVKLQADEKLEKIIKKMNGSVVADKEKIFNKSFENAVKTIKLKNDQVLVSAHQAGQASLLSVRDVLKNPHMAVIYTIFVLAASFHAINGLWTFLITWGIIISNRSQNISLRICFWIFLFALALGLISAWSSILY